MSARRRARSARKPARVTKNTSSATPAIARGGGTGPLSQGRAGSGAAAANVVARILFIAGARRSDYASKNMLQHALRSAGPVAINTAFAHRGSPAGIVLG